MKGRRFRNEMICRCNADILTDIMEIQYKTIGKIILSFLAESIDLTNNNDSNNNNNISYNDISYLDQDSNIHDEDIGNNNNL